MTARNDEASVEAVVSGHVQGVGFRYFVLGEARGRNLRGGVRNLPDGRVRVQAIGPRSALDDLVEALRRGPRAARVERVLTDWDAAFPDPGGFRIDF